MKRRTPSSRAPLRVAVVGAGGIAQMMHLPTLAERPDLFEIAGLADVDKAVLDAVGGRYGIAARATDFRELLARADVEAVLIATSGSHRDATLAALRAGKHVLVEKPVGFSLKETEDVARAARSSRGVLMVGYHKRYDPAYRRARDEVRRMRDLRLVEVTALHPDDGAYRTHHALLAPRRRRPLPEGRADGLEAAFASRGRAAAALRQTAGAGASLPHLVTASMLWQSLIHDVNAVRGILGEPEEVLSAHAWRGGLAQTSLTRFAGNVRVLLTWVSLYDLKHYEERLLFAGPDRRLSLVFPSPYLRHAPTPLRVERMAGGELVEERRTVSYEEAFRAELHHFRDCVRDGRRPETSIDDALGDARWIQAIARALAAGSPARPRAVAVRAGSRSRRRPRKGPRRPRRTGPR
jgi:predicted dehydrogenase